MQHLIFYCVFSLHLNLFSGFIFTWSLTSSDVIVGYGLSISVFVCVGWLGGVLVLMLKS